MQEADRRFKVQLAWVLLTLISAWSGATRGEAQPAENPQVAHARADLAKQRAALAADERLLTEAQAQPAGAARDQLMALGTATLEQQRRAVQQAQARLDGLLGCTGLVDQLQRDQLAIQRQQASIQGAQAELAAWTRQNEAAAHAAVQVAANGLADGLIGKAVETLDAKITATEATLRTQQPLPRFDRETREYIAALRTRIDLLRAARDGLKLQQMRQSAIDLWNSLHALSDNAQRTAGEVSDLSRKLASNAATRQIVTQVALLAAASDFEKKILQAKFPLVRDATKLGNLLVDYSYEAVRWTASRNRILQQYQVSEQQLAAVEALGCQIERTMTRLHSCRGTAAPAVSARCHAGSP